MGKSTHLKIDSRIPRYSKLIMPTFVALKELGGSGTNEEIVDQIIADLKIPDEVFSILHKGSTSKTELSYQADWARTYLRRYRVIENSARAVWSIKADYVAVDTLDEKEIVKKVTESSPSYYKNKKGAADSQASQIAAAPEGMESLEHVKERAGDFLNSLIGAEAEDILIVTHAIALKGALEYLTPESKGLYWSRYIGNCAVFRTEYDGNRYLIPEEQTLLT